MYFCPKCSVASLAWDSRCKAFLCLNRACNAYVKPPEERTSNGDTFALAITTGRIAVTQGWIDSHR